MVYPLGTTPDIIPAMPGWLIALLLGIGLIALVFIYNAFERIVIALTQPSIVWFVIGLVVGAGIMGLIWRFSPKNNN